MNHYILSDIHEDFYALQKVISEISQDTQPYAIHSLGDNIGFSTHYQSQKHKRNANGCISLLKANHVASVLGNHDLHFLGRKPKLPFFIPPPGWEALSLDEKIEHGGIWLYLDELPTQLDNDNFAYLDNLDDYAMYPDLLFSHFLFPDFNGSLILKKGQPDKLLPVHFIFMQINKLKLSFVGHLHMQQPIIISSQMEKRVLKSGESIFLDTTNTSFTVFCPAINTYNSQQSKFMSYSEESGILKYHCIDTN